MHPGFFHGHSWSCFPSSPFTFEVDSGNAFLHGQEFPQTLGSGWNHKARIGHWIRHLQCSFPASPVSRPSRVPWEQGCAQSRARHTSPDQRHKRDESSQEKPRNFGCWIPPASQAVPTVPSPPEDGNEPFIPVVSDEPSVPWGWIHPNPVLPTIPAETSS